MVLIVRTSMLKARIFSMRLVQYRVKFSELSIADFPQNM